MKGMKSEHQRTGSQNQCSKFIQSICTYMDIQNVFCLNIIEPLSTLAGNLALWIFTGPDAGQWLEADFYQQSWFDEIFFKICVLFFFNLSKDSQHIIFSGNLKVFKSQFCTCFDSLYKIYFENCCPFLLYFSNSSFSSIPFSAFGGNCLTFCCIQVPDV